MTERLRIGIDLGGTKIAVCGLGAGDQLVFEKRTPTPRNDYDKTIRTICALVEECERSCGLSGTVGIGMPGSISPQTGLVQNANSVWLNNRNLAADMSAALGRDARFANDANCFCLSEASDGAAAGAKSVFGIILGTGCGAGFVLDGRLLEGKHHIGGEWGHTQIHRTGEMPGQLPLCWCGRRGCLELYLSGPGLARDHFEATGEKLSAEQIAAGDTPACRASLERHARRLARALGDITNILDPHVIVIGGGLSKLSRLYRDLPGLMKPYIFADHFKPDIRPPKFGDASGVRGAARLWP